jgi:hypothetical protein
MPAQAQPQLPLSKRMRINIRAAHPETAGEVLQQEESSAYGTTKADIDMLIYILDWVGEPQTCTRLARRLYIIGWHAC